MGDTLTTMIAIFISAILMFIFPLMSISERSDDITQLGIQTATVDFVDKIRSTGKITEEDYDSFISTLNATGNSFDVNMEVKVLSFKGKVFGVEPPLFVELEITYTEPGFKGDTSTGATKPATTQTGYEVRVPLFVNIGDKIRIDTRTGEYMERV